MAGPLSLLTGEVLYAMIATKTMEFGVLSTWSAMVMPLSLFVGAVLLIFRYSFVREGDFSLISRAFVAQSSVRSVTHAGIGALRAGWAGLVVGDVAGRALAAAPMVWRAFPTISAQVRAMGLMERRATFVRYREFPMLSLPSA